MGGTKVRAAVAATVLMGSVLAMGGTASAFSWPAPPPRPVAWWQPAPRWNPVHQQWSSSRLDFLRYCPGRSVYDPYAGRCTADSDHDGLADGYESNVLHTSPGSWDSDHDRFPDSLEVLLGMNPTRPNRFPGFWFGHA